MACLHVCSRCSWKRCILCCYIRDTYRLVRYNRLISVFRFSLSLGIFQKRQVGSTCSTYNWEGSFKIFNHYCRFFYFYFDLPVCAFLYWSSVMCSLTHLGLFYLPNDVIFLSLWNAFILAIVFGLKSTSFAIGLSH